MASVPRNCLVCDHGGYTTEGKENYQQVSVCPKCNGAFVDLYHIHKYMKKGQRPNKEVQKQLDDKGVRDAIKGLSIGLNLATSKDMASLLVIELQDESSVPKVLYKGKEIKLKAHVLFEWDTNDGRSPRGLTYAIEHYEEGSNPVTCNRIERRTGDHA